jgi:hypothetical protein
MFTTCYTFPKTIEKIRQTMTGHVTSRYQGFSSSEVGAKIENLGTRLWIYLFIYLQIYLKHERRVD